MHSKDDDREDAGDKLVDGFMRGLGFAAAGFAVGLVLGGPAAAVAGAKLAGAAGAGGA